MFATRDSLSRVRESPGDIKGIVFNVQRYSIHDGPGIRTAVFLKGCPLRCAWCSNPESQDFQPEIAHRDSLCTKCGRCIDACSVQAISIGDKGISIDRKLCTNCAACIAVCTPGALKIFGEDMSATAVFQQVQKDEDFYRNSGGGVTVSGGEPLSQPAFVAALFKLCRDKGIHTCIETCGLGTIEALEEVLPYTSLVLFDIKLSDPIAHRKWTGRSNEEILRNLGLIVKKGAPVIIRVPLIPGTDDSDEELGNIAHTVAGILEEPVEVNLLPYHKFGLGKYQMLDRKYQLEELSTQTDAEIQGARQIFESFGFECEVVG